jgi:hypothetical protein
MNDFANYPIGPVDCYKLIWPWLRKWSWWVSDYWTKDGESGWHSNTLRIFKSTLGV